MRPPRGSAAKLAARTERIYHILDVLDALDDEIEALEAEEFELTNPYITRRSLLVRERRPWATYIKPIIGGGTFEDRFHVGTRRLHGVGRATPPIP